MSETDQAAPGNLDDLQQFTRTVPAGDLVFAAGDPGDELFVVQDGRIDLVASDDAVVLTVGPGGVFGEGSFFASRPREVSARAASEARVIRLDRSTFDRITGEAPAIATAVARQLARRVGDLQSALASRAPAAAAVPAGDPRLVAADGGQVFPLAGPGDAVVGRPDRASGFVPEVDLSALDGQRTLSRRHARIVRRGQAVVVREEKGTRNGTFVNGERLAAGQEVELRDGDQVQFGVVKLEFQWR